MVTFGIHCTENNHGINFNNGMILVDANEYNESDDEKYISKLKNSFYTHLSEDIEIPVEELVRVYGL